MSLINQGITGHEIPSVAVVILNWNGRSFLEKFLPFVLASTYKKYSVVLADNASDDGSVAFVKATYPQVKIIINAENGGFAKGYNKALAQVQADYFVLLNSDVEVTPGWIEPIISLMENDKEIGACQPKLLDEKNKKNFEYAGACGGWIDRFGYPFARGRILEYLEEDRHQYDEPQQCFWATGAAMFVRASVYREMRGLDEYFFAHQEEIDLCWRMQLSGYKIFVQPASVVYHVGGGTLPKNNNKKIYLNFRNNLIMLWKNMPASELFWKLPIRTGLDALAAWKSLATGHPGYFVAVMKAHFHFVKWVLTGRKKSLFAIEKNKKIYGKYGGSILWQYYINRKKTFSEIVIAK